MKFARRINTYFLYFAEFTIERMVLYARLLPDVNSLDWAISNQILYRNGYGVSYKDQGINVNDVLQLLVSQWFYVFSR